MGSGQALGKDTGALFPKDLAYKAAQNAPIRPAIGGLVTFSVWLKLRKMASLKCSSLVNYVVSQLLGKKRITLYNAFLTILTAKPAEYPSARLCA